MIKNILRASSYIFLSVFIASSAIFSAVSAAQAVQLNAESNGDNSMGIVIKESSDNLNGSKASSEPDLGDDQAFPFIPGFGKNSAKDWSTVSSS